MDAAKIQELFFPQLKRRVNYSLKAKGEFYSYDYYRQKFQHEIADDCLCRCVYCDSHEDKMGGRELMQIDHFRPYTRPGFEKLEDNPSNFNHACARCNLLKSDKWPSSHQTEPHDGSVGFIDPFADNRRLYFTVEADGALKPLRAPAEYLVRVLALNRPHLKLLRQQRIYQFQLSAYFAKNSPDWEKAAGGGGNMSPEELGKALLECKQLCALCGLQY